MLPLRPPGSNFSPSGPNIVGNNDYLAPNNALNQLLQYVPSTAAVQHGGQMGTLPLNNQNSNLLTYRSMPSTAVHPALRGAPTAVHQAFSGAPTAVHPAYKGAPTAVHPAFRDAPTAVHPASGPPPVMCSPPSTLFNVPNQPMPAQPMRFAPWQEQIPVIPEKRRRQDVAFNREQNPSILKQRLQQNDTTVNGMTLPPPQAVAGASSVSPQAFLQPTVIGNQIIFCLDDDLYKKVTSEALDQFILGQSQAQSTQECRESSQNMKKVKRKEPKRKSKPNENVLISDCIILKEASKHLSSHGQDLPNIKCEKYEQSGNELIAGTTVAGSSTEGRSALGNKSGCDLLVATSNNMAVSEFINPIIKSENEHTIVGAASRDCGENFIKHEASKTQISGNEFEDVIIEHNIAVEILEYEEMPLIDDKEDQKNNSEYWQPVIKSESRSKIDKNSSESDQYSAISNEDKICQENHSVSELETAKTSQTVIDNHTLLYGKRKTQRVELSKKDTVDNGRVRKTNLGPIKGSVKAVNEKHKSSDQKTTTQLDNFKVKDKTGESGTMQKTKTQLDNVNVNDENDESGTMQHTSTIAIEKEELPDEDEAGFNWTPDFYSFRGEKETYSNNSHPTTDSVLPYDLFTSVWDKDIMTRIAKITNENIAKNSKSSSFISHTKSSLRDSMKIVDTDELYTLFALLIYMGFSDQDSMKDYWKADLVGGIPAFASAMTLNRFLVLNAYLKFPDSAPLTDVTDVSKKILEVSSIVDHCNNKFKALYVPQQYLTIDRRSIFKKKKHSKKSSGKIESNIKWYHLCEAQTGYMLKCELHAESVETVEKQLVGLDSFSDKVVLNLMKDYLDAGHHLSMNYSFNNLPLTRYLKRRRTDVIGTINKNAQYLPKDIQNLTEKTLPLHDYLALHCSDISLAVWRDHEIERLISTYHDDCVAETDQADMYGVVKDFDETMSGIEIRDNMLLKYINEPTDTHWLLRVLKRLLNYSLLNMYIIRKKNMGEEVDFETDFDSFRHAIADAVISCHVRSSPHLVSNRSSPNKIRNQECNTPVQPSNVGHIPDYLSNYTTGMRVCVQCFIEGRNTMVDTICQQCDLSVCLGNCWARWHNKNTS